MSKLVCQVPWDKQILRAYLTCNYLVPAKEKIKLLESQKFHCYHTEEFFMRPNKCLCLQY